MTDGNTSDVIAAWGFLVDANWNDSSVNWSETTTSALTVLEAAVWTPGVVFRVATIAVMMVVTLVGNVSLIAIIASQGSLRRKRVSVFLVNLAVGDLMVCLVTMSTEILFVAFGEWLLGALACKLIVYGQIVTLASTTFLLTAMSIDRYQAGTSQRVSLYAFFAFFAFSLSFY